MRRRILSVCLFVLYYSPMVVADRMVRFVFNDGIPPTPHNGCSEADDAYIDPLFNITTLLRRRDRHLLSARAASTSTTDYDSPEHRELRNYPAKCKDNCYLIATGTCRASGCQGYRRRNLLGDLLGDGDVLTCDDQISLIHTALDVLIETNVVSSPCQTFLVKSKRKAECYDDVVYGEILGFTIFTSTTTSSPVNRWSSPYQQPPPPPPKTVVTKLQENTPNGYVTCSSVPINIELALNPCVKSVQFTVTVANSTMPPITRIDSEHPMIVMEPPPGKLRSSFSPSSPYANTIRLPPGTYIVSAIPDNFAYKEKKLEFHVHAC